MEFNPLIPYQEGFDEGVRVTKKNQDDQDFLDQAMIAAMQGAIASGKAIRPKTTLNEGEVTLGVLVKDSIKVAKALLEERNKMMGGDTKR